MIHAEPYYRSGTDIKEIVLGNGNDIVMVLISSLNCSDVAYSTKQNPTQSFLNAKKTSYTCPSFQTKMFFYVYQKAKNFLYFPETVFLIL